MSEIGKALIEAMQDAIDNGVVDVSTSVRVKRIRKKLGMSQAEFAKTYHLPLSNVRSWEQGKRKPDGGYQNLISCIEVNPQAMAEIVQQACA